MADAYGSASKAGGPAQVASAGVGEVIVATDGGLRGHGAGAGGCATHHTVGTIGLVSHTCVGARAHHIGAGFFALSLVHDLQVWMASAPGHEKRALIAIRVTIAAADGMLTGNVGAVGGTYTLGPSCLHLAHLSWSTLDAVAVFFAGLAMHNSKKPQQSFLNDGSGGVGPCGVKATTSAAFLSSDSLHEDHITARLLTLLQPTHAGFCLILSKYQTQSNKRRAVEDKESVHDDNLKR